MPTKKEITAQMLKEWCPWNQIIEKTGTGSGTYEELRLFLEGTANQVYEDLRSENIKLVELRRDLVKTSKTIMEQESENKRIERDIEVKRKEQIQLATKNDELNKENLILKSNIKELIERGADDDVLLRIKAFDHRDKVELLQRIASLKDYAKVLDETESKKSELGRLNTEIAKIKSELIDKTNRITELNADKARLSEELDNMDKLVKISNTAISYGYSPTAFESLLKTIKNYLEATPYKTNSKVFEALQEHQNLQAIREATIIATKDNQVTRTESLHLRGELDAVKTQIFVTIKEIEKRSIEVLESQKKEAEKVLLELGENQRKLLNEGTEGLENVWSNIQEKSQTWDAKLREIAKYEFMLKNSLVLSTAYYSPEAAKNLTLHDVSLLAQVVDHWVQYNLRGEKSITPNEVRESHGFGTGYFSLPGLSKFLSLELNKRAQS